MECIRPIKAGFDSDYNLTFSQKKFNKELSPFEFPCRKCLACRLNMAREKAIRAIHESKSYENNIFLTLTYDQEHIGDGKLHYRDFQLFMKKLRKEIYESTLDYDKHKHRISYMVTGEYGDKTKRPHWHAIIFNYSPSDKKFLRNDPDQPTFTSEIITNLWGNGSTMFGNVTLDSASYVARYAAKKLGHGKDQDHDYHPIHKTSSKHAIGKSFIEKYYQDIFNHGFVVLPNGQKAGIPRYYEDWFKKNHPDAYLKYLSTIKSEASILAQDKQKTENLEYLAQCEQATGGLPLTKKQVSMTILKQKFKQLQERKKL